MADYKVKFSQFDEKLLPSTIFEVDDCFVEIRVKFDTENKGRYYVYRQWSDGKVTNTGNPPKHVLERVFGKLISMSMVPLSLEGMDATDIMFLTEMDTFDDGGAVHHDEAEEEYHSDSEGTPIPDENLHLSEYEDV